MEQKVYDSHKTSLDLLNHFKDKEKENDALKEYTLELKSRIQVYIPVEDDPIDF